MAIVRTGFVVVVSLCALSAACKKEEPPPAAPVQPVVSAYPPPQPPPVSTGSPMAVPGPTALACQSDAQCMTHRCNLQYQKCAFPCQSDADCIQGTMCIVALGPVAACVPKPPSTP